MILQPKNLITNHIRQKSHSKHICANIIRSENNIVNYKIS